MKLFLNLLLTALGVVVLANILPGVQVDTYMTALIVAVILAVLNIFVKPLLVVFTLPITVLTLGLFLLVINAFIILIASNLITGFEVDGFWTAILFSVLLAILESILHSLLNDD
ncbi:phage holin family protein [Tamlana sp. 2_MG-2023]|uniref:phage holin family protein n=1 Tax=unclassified Tamlana TaxID=2614803 RepID=UPI0026E38B23|nr:MULTISPECIES: phage holin family protein [unclassified Tamlana]MDO6761004.1 phage holin family protein [Tamlana sp. 2_MG-2023]MDO6791663.1 phage holin family protein [Tamlana sp. 1_MG-2023]